MKVDLLKGTDQPNNQDNYQQQTQAATGAVAPIATVSPGGQNTQEQQNQYD